MRGQRGLHVVRVVLDVVVFQDWLQSSVIFLMALLGACHLGCQALFWEKRLLPWRQVDCLDDVFYCVLDRSPFLFCLWVWMCGLLFW